MEKTVKVLQADDLDSCALIDVYIDQAYLKFVWLDCSTMWVFEEWIHITEDSIHVLNQEGGNQAAGTRVRKQMQDIKQAAQTVRNSILEIRSAQ
jgi:hypothetical protein